jgi:hypothetical protein
MARFWTLDADHNLVPTDDVLVWAAFYEDFPRRMVARDELGEGVKVITVCTGLDHSFGESERPLLFGTALIVAGKIIDEEETSTWDEAVVAHRAMVETMHARWS